MSPYSKQREQGIDMSGLISVNNLHKAIYTAGFDHTDMDSSDISEILADEKHESTQLDKSLNKIQIYKKKYLRYI